MILFEGTVWYNFFYQLCLV